MGEAIRSGGAKGWRGAGLVVFVFVWSGSSGDIDRNFLDRLSMGVDRTKCIRLRFFCQTRSRCVFHATVMGMQERCGLCLLIS